MALSRIHSRVDKGIGIIPPVVVVRSPLLLNRFKLIRCPDGECGRVRKRVGRLPIRLLNHVKVERGLARRNARPGTQRVAVWSNHELERTSPNFAGLAESQLRMWPQSEYEPAMIG